ncbi:hypothetical protein Unana1_02894 [Umbelopsis nana]
MDATAKAIVLQKTEGPYHFKELIIQCGPIQLLAIGGSYGQVGGNTKTAFLGSTLPKHCQLSTEETYNIMIPFFKPNYTRTIRHFRNYIKANADRCWSFGSEDLNGKNSYRVIPSSMTITQNESTCRLHNSQGKITPNIKKVFAKIPEVVDLLSKCNTIPQTLVELKQLLQVHDAKSSLLTLLDFAVRLERELADKEQIELVFMSEELSEKPLALYKSYFAHAIKDINKKLVQQRQLIQQLITQQQQQQQQQQPNGMVSTQPSLHGLPVRPSYDWQPDPLLYDRIPSLAHPIFYQTLSDDERKAIIERYPVVQGVKYTPPATIPQKLNGSSTKHSIVKTPLYDTYNTNFGNPAPQSEGVYAVLNDIRTLILNLCGSATTARNNLALRAINPAFQLQTENGSDYTMDHANFQGTLAHNSSVLKTLRDATPRRSKQVFPKDSSPGVGGSSPSISDSTQPFRRITNAQNRPSQSQSNNNRFNSNSNNSTQPTANRQYGDDYNAFTQHGSA